MIMKKLIVAAVLCLLVIAFPASRSVADDWPGWRGLHRDGTSKETGLLQRWPRKGPRLKWRARNAGEGYSSFAISEGRLFTMGNRGRNEYVIAYDEQSGKELWAEAIGKAFKQGAGNGPRGTPTVDGAWLYAEGAGGEVVCLDTKTGDKRWGFNILSTFDGKNIGWGLSESPLVVDEMVIVCPGARDASVVALRKDTGEVLWKSPGERPGYASPILVHHGRGAQVVVFNARAAVGMNLKNGRRLWSYTKASNGTANCTTPVYHAGRVFVTSDYGTGGGLVRLVPKGRGRVDAEEVYFNKNMKNHHGGVVLVDNSIYGFSSSTLACIDFETGERRWRDRSVGKGSLIYADGHLYCLSENGVVGLVEATPRGYREKSRFSIGKGKRPTWAHPALANGALFLRKDGEIRCYDVRAKKR